MNKLLQLNFYLFVMFMSIIFLPSMLADNSPIPLAKNYQYASLTEKESRDLNAYYGCIDEQRVGYYTKLNASQGIPKENIIRILEAKFKANKQSRVSIKRLHQIIELAYSDRYTNIDKYRFTYKIFKQCMDRNHLEPARFILPVQEA